MVLSEIERRKGLWRKIGDWMDTAEPEDTLPEFSNFDYSSSERRLIKATLQAATAKRIEFIKLEMRIIESSLPDYRWSDLMAYPDVQQAIKNNCGFSDETWVENVLPMFLRLRPRSPVILQMISLEKIRKLSLNGSIHIGLKTLESTVQAQKENYRKRRYKKTKYPEEKINLAVSIYRKWENLEEPKPLKKVIIGDIKLIFSKKEEKQPSSKQIERWASQTKNK